MNHQQAEALRNDPKHWTIGIIYFCREDPRPLVRNRVGMGWTWNFGSPLALPCMAVAILVFLLPMLLFVPGIVTAGVSFIGPGELLAIYVVLVVILAGVSHYIANGPR